MISGNSGVRVEALLYRRKYCPLHEAVQLIADRLGAADRQNYADADAGAAIADARKQLLEALFEGAVRAEGVHVYPTEEPPYEAPSIEYDIWYSIDQGVWLHERCEKEEDYLYRLNTISIHWNEDYIDYYNNDGQWAEYMNTKIRLLFDDVDREFPAPQTTNPPNGPLSGPETTYRTGVAGRPTSKDLVKREMQRRAEKGDLSSSLAAEIRKLRDWLKRQHPDAPQLTQSALQNALRDDYRKLKSAHPSR